MRMAMSSNWYFASLEQNNTGEIFAFMEDLPGVTAAGKSVTEALRYLSEFAADHVRDLADAGEPIPKPTPWHKLPEKEPTVFSRVAVPVEMPGKSVKISISIDSAVLARADRAAEEVGDTRSGFFAAAVSERAQKVLYPPFNQEAFARAIERAGGLETVVRESMLPQTTARDTKRSPKARKLLRLTRRKGHLEA
jgi:predicted RNase H-like HicB family nuclease